MHNVAIIGAGNIGRAIAGIIRKKAKIQFWDAEPGKVKGQQELEAIVPGAEVVFLCVPSGAIPAATHSIRPFLKKKSVVVSIAKGIETKSGETIDAVLKRNLPAGQPFALLSGPMLAAELMRNLGGSAAAASSSALARKALQDLFRGTELHVRASEDVRGVALAGVLKNIYALVLGAAEGMGLGWNAKGFLVAEAVSEMHEMMPKLGGKHDTVLCPAGLGDLIATGMSKHSRNRETGRALASGSSNILPSESLSSVPWMLKKLGASKAKYPLLLAAAKLAKDPKNGKEAIRKVVFGK